MKDQKFTNWNDEKGFRIPAAALEMAKIKKGEKLDLHVADHVAVILKHEMTALEMIRSIDALHELYLKLLDDIAASCGPCAVCECGDEDNDGCCPYDLDREDFVSLPTGLREDADIPSAAKLQAEADRENRRVIITPASYTADLTDVPEYIIALLEKEEIRLCELVRQLMKGEKLYG